MNSPLSTENLRHESRARSSSRESAKTSKMTRSQNAAKRNKTWGWAAHISFKERKRRRPAVYLPRHPVVISARAIYDAFEKSWTNWYSRTLTLFAFRRCEFFRTYPKVFATFRSTCRRKAPHHKHSLGMSQQTNRCTGRIRCTVCIEARR